MVYLITVVHTLQSPWLGFRRALGSVGVGIYRVTRYEVELGRVRHCWPTVSARSVVASSRESRFRCRLICLITSVAPAVGERRDDVYFYFCFYLP